MNELIKDAFYVILIFALAFVAFYLGTRNSTLEQRTNRYDCSLTEFVPDVPPDVREECRRRRIEQLNQQQGQ
jgi:hypothetical protein